MDIGVWFLYSLPYLADTLQRYSRQINTYCGNELSALQVSKNEIFARRSLFIGTN